MAGVLPLPTEPSPQEAGELLAAGWWDERWVQSVDQCFESDLIILARAMAAHPAFWSKERVDRVAVHVNATMIR